MSQDNGRIIVPGPGAPQLVQVDPVVAKSLELQAQTVQLLQVLTKQMDQLIAMKCGHLSPRDMRRVFEEFEAKQKGG